MIKPLTSLRFLFALMVFTSHLDFVKGAPSWYNWLSRNIFFEGYLGVSFFFILSGFVLSYSYKEKIIYHSISLKDFYIARFARVYPLHLLTLFLILPFTFHNYFERGYRYSIYYWFPMCFVIFAFAHQKGYISKLLSNKWLVLLGEISFAFYMIHYLIIKYGLWLKYLYIKNLNDLAFSLILLFITLLLSYETFKFYEKPMNSFTKKKLIKNDS